MKSLSKHLLVYCSTVVLFALGGVVLSPQNCLAEGCGAHHRIAHIATEGDWQLTLEADNDGSGTEYRLELRQGDDDYSFWDFR